MFRFYDKLRTNFSSMVRGVDMCVPEAMPELKNFLQKRADSCSSKHIKDQELLELLTPDARKLMDLACQKKYEDFFKVDNFFTQSSGGLVFFSSSSTESVERYMTCSRSVLRYIIGIELAGANLKQIEELVSSVLARAKGNNNTLDKKVLVQIILKDPKLIKSVASLLQDLDISSCVQDILLILKSFVPTESFGNPSSAIVDTPGVDEKENANQNLTEPSDIFKMERVSAAERIRSTQANPVNTLVSLVQDKKMSEEDIHDFQEKLKEISDSSLSVEGLCSGMGINVESLIESISGLSGGQKGKGLSSLLSSGVLGNMFGDGPMKNMMQVFEDSLSKMKDNGKTPQSAADFTGLFQNMMADGGMEQMFQQFSNFTSTTETAPESPEDAERSAEFNDIIEKLKVVMQSSEV